MLKTFNRKNCLLLIALLTTIMVCVEWAMGRLLFCKCGIISVWSGDIWSNENSQQLMDPYTLTHILHGWIFYFLLWLVCRKRFKFHFWPMLVVAVLLECSWEILENTNWVINRYRENTISLDYYGDSIFNSFADVWAMALGFWLASKVMLFYPIEAIKAWQMPSAF